jgi:hypothetical protein
VNKSFHEIASFKQLWLSIVRDLSRARVIDAPAEETLETLSTAELVEEVRRAVVGPRTWSPASSVPPTVHRQFSIPLKKYTVTHPAELLPGGTHILRFVSESYYPRSNGIELWEVCTGKRIWEWGRVDYDVFYAATDFQAGTSKVRVAILYLFGG